MILIKENVRILKLIVYRFSLNKGAYICVNQNDEYKVSINTEHKLSLRFEKMNKALNKIKLDFEKRILEIEE